LSRRFEIIHSYLPYEYSVIIYKEDKINKNYNIFYNLSDMKFLMKGNASLAVTYDPNWLKLWTLRFYNPLLDVETSRLTLKGTLTEIDSKPKSVDEIQDQYMGSLRFTPDGSEEVVRSRSKLSAAKSDSISITSILQMVIDAKKISAHLIP
jgi:GTP1/Obg family GTP-binding protein